jgi:hypothetical protein
MTSEREVLEMILQELKRVNKQLAQLCKLAEAMKAEADLEARARQLEG